MLRIKSTGRYISIAPIVRAHQQQREQKELNPGQQSLSVEQMQQQEALGRSKAASAQIHIQAEGMGKPMQFVLTEGQRSDLKVRHPQYCAEGQAYWTGKTRSNVVTWWVIKAMTHRRFAVQMRRQHTTPVIPKRMLNANPASIVDCTETNRIERLINRLKQFRRVATRYENEAENYLAMLMIAAILIWLK